MATIGVGFRWLDILEKEFDKACVELNTSLSELEAEEPETVVSARQKIATLTSCFAQLTHKSLTIFQNSAKLEAELVDMRAELVQARAVSAGALQDGGDAPGNVLEVARARSEAAQLARENAALRETVLALHSELFGARLATKYLDKELAGRIQQLQLLGRDMRSELRDSLWAQVEAEILLQRHKTLVRVCRGLSPRPPPAPARAAERSRPRTVRVRRSPHLGLGISVTGGREHGVPILISELEEGGPAALTGELCVGDAILAINDVDLTQACHKEAVHALQSVKGDCALCVQFIATDDDDRLSEDNYRFPLYPEDGEVFEREQDGSGATPTAPRTPDYNNSRDDCEAGSDSECRSPVHRYPDYGGVNNHAILDMDDDSIKIQASVEPTAAECRGSWGESPGGGGGGGRGARALARGAYASLDQSSESPASTPVHRRARVRSHNKRHYRALDTGNDSSDDKQEEQARSAPSPREEARAAAGAPQPLGAARPPQPLGAARPQPAPAPPPGRPRGDGRQRGGNGPKGFRIGSARRVTEPPPPLTNGDVERAHGKLPARSHLPPSQPPPSHQPPSQPPPSHQLPSQPPPSHQPPSQPPLSHQPPSQPTPSHQPPSSQPPPSHQTPSQPPPSQPPPSHQPPSQPPPSQPTLPYLAPSHQTPSHLAPSHLPPSQPLPLLAGDGDPDFGTPV